MINDNRYVFVLVFSYFQQNAAVLHQQQEQLARYASAMLCVAQLSSNCENWC
jgi:hypothetical protein